MRNHEHPLNNPHLWNSRISADFSRIARHDRGESTPHASGLSQGRSSSSSSENSRGKASDLYWGLLFWLLLLGFPTASALSAKAAHAGFLEIFLSAFGVIFVFNLVDWLILDWLVFCTITPRFAVLPGTEGMAGYKNYAMHFRGFLIGTALSVVTGLIIAAIIAFV